jgi:predicted phosphodiesterase
MPRDALRLFARSVLALLVLAAAACGQATAPTTGPTTAPADLLAGASWQYGTDGGASFSPHWPEGLQDKALIIAKAEFQVADLAGAAALELRHDLDRKNRPTFGLNGTPLQAPHGLEKVFLRTIPAIDPGLLTTGTNTLVAQWQFRKPADPSAALAPPHVELSLLRPGDLKLVAGPILGARGDDYLTVSCRTNLPARVTVRLFGGFAEGEPAPGEAKPALRWRLFTAVSQRGLFHQVRIDGLAHLASATYQLQATTADGAATIQAGPWSVTTLPADEEPWRFAAVGDSRTHPENWALVAMAVLKARPQWLIHTGDIVENGLEDWQWNEQCLGPAATLLATTPTFVAIGNHEQDSPLVGLLFALPPEGTVTHWQQTIGSVQLIGIDGRADWAQTSDNVAWLERVLAGSNAKFLFLIIHYPPWTSSRHGELAEDGHPKEKPIRQGQEVLLPLLATHHATAVISGHSHLYERSEPPGGVTVITTGGGGAPLHEPVENAAKQNPYSKLVVSTLHYCLFTVRADQCTMEALAPDGHPIDTCSWQARPEAAATTRTLTTQPSDQ